VVGDRQSKAEVIDNRTDQPFRLAQSEPEHGSQSQRRQDRQRRIPSLAPSGRPRFRCPSRYCVIGKPNRQAATLTRAGFIGRPVGDFVLLPWNVVAAVLVQFDPTFPLLRFR